ncbi:MAG: hypothetical protein ACLQNE_39050 [Thermoguttaceae bacterium]
MADGCKELHERVDAIEEQVAALQRGRIRGIRKQAVRSLWGLPLYDIAIGPDPEKGEQRGHARGVLAIGDIATGVLALGGMARGVIALGGVALGIVALGGCSVGIFLALGGLAVAGVAVGGLAVGVVAVGGAALGVVAIGGGAAGYYACGGGAVGKFVISATERSPEAIDFFAPWIPGLRR